MRFNLASEQLTVALGSRLFYMVRARSLKAWLHS